MSLTWSAVLDRAGHPKMNPPPLQSLVAIQQPAKFARLIGGRNRGNELCSLISPLPENGVAKVTAVPIVRAAAVQISPVLYSRQVAVEKVVKKICELDKQGVQFATFTATAVLYYPSLSFIQAPVQTSPEPSKGSCSTRPCRCRPPAPTPLARLPSRRASSSRLE